MISSWCCEGGILDTLDLVYQKQKGRSGAASENNKDDLIAFRTAALGYSSSVQLPLVMHYKTCESAQSSYYLTLWRIDNHSACRKAPSRVMG